MSVFPAIERTIPHADPMVLLAEIETHDQDVTVCRVADPEKSIFADGEGQTPAWIALEYMAQCCAVHGALQVQDAAPRSGFLIGTRCLNLFCSEFEPGSRLSVSARPVYAHRELAAFDCEVVDQASGAVRASAQLKIFRQPEDSREP